MKKFTLYLGLNDKDTKTQKIGTLEAYKVCMNLLSRYTDGGTIFEADGFYRHEDGTLTVEKTLRIELLFIDRATAMSICRELKAVFNQESIAMQEDSVSSELV